MGITTGYASGRPGFGQWALFFVLAFWLALVPLGVTIPLSALSDSPPNFLVQAGLIPPGGFQVAPRALALLVTGITLALDLVVFVPLHAAGRRRGREFLRTTTTLLVAISLFLALTSLARLPTVGEGDPPSVASQTIVTAFRLALILPFLLLGLGGLEARQHDQSLRAAWQRVGLRLWINPVALWLSLGVTALVVGPWVGVGSLGSAGTTWATVVQALPDSLGDEILFRAFAFAWLWRAVHNRGWAATGSLVLFVAAQGGGGLPSAGLETLPRFAESLMLGLLATELTVRAGGSIWPAVTMHFLYVWFPLAFVDPRSQEEVLHWLVRIWMPVAAGGLWFFLWLGRMVAQSLSKRPASRPGRRNSIAAVAFAGASWLVVVVLYGLLGVPGFHPDGFLIFLDEQADLSPAAAIPDPVERRSWVYHALVETAERTQAPLREELERRDVPYQAHYLTNMIEVEDRPGLRRALAKRPGVASVLFHPGVRRYPRTFEIPNLDSGGPQGVEWNVREVGADRVWDLGFRGQGVIVGNADTGVDWQHPALKESYLGWDGMAATHDYHWYDPWDSSAEPWDDSGHGTHTAGTVSGLDGENRIGVAPGAEWIACRNMRHGIGNPGKYIGCMEFLFAPFPLGGDPLRDGDPSRGAHLVNNSWGCPPEEGCEPDTLRIAVDNLRIGAQLMVASAGNYGPACSTVQDPPAIYDSVFSVGAITREDRSTSFSSRGPVARDGSQRIKPDIVAPGEEIRSSVPDGYASLPGTSMAGPHVAGTVALLWSADPALIGDLDRTEEILTTTAQPLTVDAVCTAGRPERATVCACGDDGPDSVPNQVYGWGQVDAWAAVQAHLEGR